MGSHALLPELRKRGPWAEGIINGEHRLRWGGDSNTTDGIPYSLTQGQTAEAIYYTLDPPRNHCPQMAPSVHAVLGATQLSVACPPERARPDGAPAKGRAPTVPWWSEPLEWRTGVGSAEVPGLCHVRGPIPK